ncbi:DUF742 domain-containing protein [Actinomadura litoris]|uniref:DUF742 domain-containing protein n=1 Tax=Actinomadura litoris TaxID=2678616 RepID=A0A7K1LBH1_9ACTN|nr:DUF742 domain-containing protein [Actinomadura litoris]MUN41663.1 DUF742 domain-containing protein [Actinomadura litoris]
MATDTPATPATPDVPGRDPRHPFGGTTPPAPRPPWDAPWASYPVEQVRPFALIGGRTRPRHPIQLITLLSANNPADQAADDTFGGAPGNAGGGAGRGAAGDAGGEVAAGVLVQGRVPEADLVVGLCRERPRSLAEIAARIGLPVQAAKIIVSDLLDAGALVVPPPLPEDRDRRQLLEALLTGLEAMSDVA